MVNVLPVPALASSTVVPSGSGPSRSNGSGTPVASAAAVMPPLSSEPVSRSRDFLSPHRRQGTLLRSRDTGTVASRIDPGSRAPTGAARTLGPRK